MVLRLTRKFHILFSYVMILLWESWRWSSRPLDHSLSCDCYLISDSCLSLASYISCEKQKAVVSSMMIEMVSYLGKTLLKAYWHMLQRPLVTFCQETDKTLLDLHRHKWNAYFYNQKRLFMSLFYRFRSQAQHTNKTHYTILYITPDAQPLSAYSSDR